MRLAVSPVAPTLQIREKMNQGSISSGMRLSFSGGIFLKPWGQKGEHRAKAETVLSGPEEAGGWGTSLGLCCSFVSIAEWLGHSCDPGEPIQFFLPGSWIWDLGPKGFRQPRQGEQGAREQAPSPFLGVVLL